MAPLGSERRRRVRRIVHIVQRSCGDGPRRKHAVSDSLGPAWSADRLRRERSGGSVVGCISAGTPERSGFLGRIAVYGDRFSEGILFEIPSLPSLFSYVCIGSISTTSEGLVRFPLTMTASMSKY